MISDRGTRLTALMAGHGLTFAQIYQFYVETVHGLAQPHLRAQVVTFMTVMVLGIAAAYVSLMIPPDRRPALRRSLEGASGALLLIEWFFLGYAFVNMH